MKLTSKAKYGLKICFEMGKNPGNCFSAPQLAEITGYSAKYIEKLMKYLKDAEIVNTERGAGGGYFLSRLPKDITLGEILRALEDNLEFVKCIGTACGNECFCPTYGVWKKLYKGINELLDSMTLNDILDSCNEYGGKKSNEKKNISGPCGNNKC